MRRQPGTFEEAAPAFRDLMEVIFDDDFHPEDEYRELIIGHSERHWLLIVSFSERDDMIRIISARRAKKRERDGYERYLDRSFAISSSGKVSLLQHAQQRLGNSPSTQPRSGGWMFVNSNSAIC